MENLQMTNKHSFPQRLARLMLPQPVMKSAYTRAERSEFLASLVTSKHASEEAYFSLRSALMLVALMFGTVALMRFTLVLLQTAQF